MSWSNYWLNGTLVALLIVIGSGLVVTGLSFIAGGLWDIWRIKKMTKRHKVIAGTVANMGFKTKLVADELDQENDVLILNEPEVSIGTIQDMESAGIKVVVDTAEMRVELS